MKIKAYEIVIVMFVLVLVAACFGCKNRVEARLSKTDMENVHWIFQGTYCLKCNYLYNFDEYPKVCDKCSRPTKNYYYMVMIKDIKDEKTD